MKPTKGSSTAKIFRSAEKKAMLSDKEFGARKDRLRLDLVELQQKVRAAGRFPVIIVLAGVRGAGVVDTLNLLNSWMDPRWIETNAFDQMSDEESERPPFWRYWRSLPAAGTAGLFLEGWYGELLGLDPTRPPAGCGTVDDWIRDIAAFEQNLADDGALILKFWLHLSEAQQRRKDEAAKNDPLTGIRIGDAPWRPQPPYGVYTKAAAGMIAATHVDLAPWHIVAGNDANHRRATVLEVLRDSVKRHLKRAARPVLRAKARAPAPRTGKSVLDTLDMDKSLSGSAYAKAFHTQQRRLYDAQQAARAAGISTVIALEGWDASGKGGAIRRLTYAMTATNYKVMPIAEPTEEERKYHYLWRFWRRLGRAGHVTIFDRSWYGRVLVERVDQFVPRAAWQRAYDEINVFEEQLTSCGVVLIKFWLHVDREEQLKRFKARKETPHKRWKLTKDDWHNRAQWDAYVAAVDDMVKRTSPPAAPWRLIPANNKSYARLAIVEAVADALEEALERSKSSNP